MKSNTQTHPSTRHRVREAIQNRILSGQFTSGQRLTQIDLAKEFSVAQTVVRESLLELSFCGLVEVVENVGVFVRDMSPEALLEAYQIREVFEGLAARLCCEHASRRDLSHLAELAEQIRATGQAGRFDQTGRLDRQFHQYTIHISGHQMLERLTEGYRLLGMVVRAERDVDTVYHEHLAIIDAMRNEQPDEAERLAREHVRAARLAVQQMVSEGRFRPNWVMEPDPANDAS